MLNPADFIIPDWSAPPTIKAIISTRAGGVSAGVYASLNLGNHVGDDIASVAENRQRFCSQLPRPPMWLRQVHGSHVVIHTADAPDVAAAPETQTQTKAETETETETAADAAVTHHTGIPCAVMVADCLPVLLCDKAGTVVAAAHAGWRGLCGGVLQNTVASMRVPPGQIMAYLGPAIGPRAFEVGAEVRAAFMAVYAEAEDSFSAAGDGKYRANIYQLARLFLAHAGVSEVHGGEIRGEQFCTVSQPERFFSYRRDGVTGRMAAAIWLEDSPSRR